MKKLNVIRYVIAIILPIIIALLSPVFGICFAFLVLLFNNIIDDIVFYYGSAYIDSDYKGGIPCPVNGIVTKVEHDVPLYNHLIKSDVLTKEELIKAGVKSKSKKRFNHVTIFLNKLNKHIVAKMLEGGIVSSVMFDSNNEMVTRGELIAKNEGLYLRNTFAEISYKNGIKVVVTMDKYISKAVVCQNNIEMLICRGSQCDIYLPVKYDIAVKENQKVEIYDALSLSEDIREGVKNKRSVFNDTLRCIQQSGTTIAKIVKENILKTTHTFVYNIPMLILCLMLSMFSPTSLFTGFFIYLYLFMFNRSSKNLLYAIMNIIGYKEWMTKTYKIINKLTIYG